MTVFFLLLSSNVEVSVSTGSAISVVVDDSPVTNLIVLIDINSLKVKLMMYKCLPVS